MLSTLRSKDLGLEIEHQSVTGLLDFECAHFYSLFFVSATTCSNNYRGAITIIAKPLGSASKNLTGLNGALPVHAPELSHFIKCDSCLQPPRSSTRVVLVAAATGGPRREFGRRWNAVPTAAPHGRAAVPSAAAPTGGSRSVATLWKAAILARFNLPPTTTAFRKVRLVGTAFHRRPPHSRRW